MAHYPDVDPNPDFPAIEKQVIDFWNKNGTFAQSVEKRARAKEFIFYDGPPFANGLPHYGHLLTGYVKDLYARYQTMRGKKVERRFGWDCHGLPAEMGAEKELGISGRQAIIGYGIDKFNEYCRTSVMKYTREWEEYVTRQARWVDFKNDYKTMDKNFMESVLWAFKQLYDKGLVYEAYRVMPYSWAAETPLSNFETKLDNSYREREDKAIYVRFKLKRTLSTDQAIPTYVIAWTTTPWTLPSNLALAVNPAANYHARFGKDGSIYFYASFAESKISSFIEFNEEARTLVLMGKEILNWEYEPLFPYFKDSKNAFRVLDGFSFVTDADGTGIVHMAPGFGEDDQKCCEANGIELVVPVDEKGRYTDAIFDLIERPPLEGGQVLRQENRGGYQKLAERKYDEVTLQRAKELRKGSTEAEQKLWGYLRGKRLEGYKFRRQHPIGGFIADFYCATAKLVIELDGGQHNEAEYIAYDKERTAFLQDAGYRVLRFWNSEVLNNIEGAGDKILETLHTPPESAGADSAPPQGGGIELRLKGLNVIAEPGGSKFGLANDRIIDYLKKTGGLIKQEQIKHNYPHCWRTDQPLIYRAMPSWYVEVTKFRDRAVEINKTINWIPEHIRDGQMGHMLATAPDWSISRNRFWGTPIPVWRAKSGKVIVCGSIEEIERLSGKKVKDLHRPYIDEITIEKDGETYTRVDDVFDCWFESGSMPFAQVHYPFENKEWFEKHFPADFITEYVGQTRGWFNTLIMLSTALFDCAPFKNCICHGVVLDSETGLKYSKRLKNYKDPMEVMDKFGADALRWLMISSPVMRGQDLSVDPEGKFIRDVVRLAIKPIWNAYNFFCLYANADGIKAKLATDSADVMDRYILAKCRQAVEKIQAALDAYDTPAACDAVSQFFEALNNWYIRRNKERFWKSEHDADKQAAYDTLYTVLTTLCRAAAPLLPLTLDEIYKGLTGEESVHLADFPSVIPAKAGIQADDELIVVMDRVQDVCNGGLSIRNQLNIRVRQPLAQLDVVGYHLDALNSYGNIIEEELNVKKVVIHPANEMANFGAFKLQIISAQLGKRLKADGKEARMKEIIVAAKNNQWEKTKAGERLVAGELLKTGEYKQLLEPKPEYKDRAQALSTNDALVILDTTITPELEAEGLARDVVRMIQQARKDAKLNVSDRITLHLDAPPDVARAVAAHKAYIMEQTLTTELLDKKPSGELFSSENQIDDKKVVISFSKAA